MATSSIFASFDITDREKARAFAEALEWSATHPVPHPNHQATVLTDEKELDKLFRELSRKYGCHSKS
mgnify:CR=1 FL=1